MFPWAALAACSLRMSATPGYQWRSVISQLDLDLGKTRAIAAAYANKQTNVDEFIQPSTVHAVRRG